MCVYIVKLPPDTLPQWRQFGWRHCDLTPIYDLRQEEEIIQFQFFLTRGGGTVAQFDEVSQIKIYFIIVIKSLPKYNFTSRL